jgi:hypothetical protein
MLVLGVGIGMVMQVLVIAVQNAVDYRDLGVATSGATLFRLVGGSLGTALLGAIFSASLSAKLAHITGSRLDVRNLAALSPALRDTYAKAYASSIDTIFIIAAMIAATGFLLAIILPERPLRRTVAATAGEPGEEIAESFAQPLAPDSGEELRREVAILANRDVQRAHIAKIVERAGLTLTPAAAFLLVRIERDPSLDLSELAQRYRIPREVLPSAERELDGAGLIESDVARKCRLTSAGCDALNRLVDARRAYLADLVSDWPVDQREAVASQLRMIAEGLVPEVKPS